MEYCTDFFVNIDHAMAPMAKINGAQRLEQNNIGIYTDSDGDQVVSTHIEISSNMQFDVAHSLALIRRIHGL